MGCTVGVTVKPVPVKPVPVKPVPVHKRCVRFSSKNKIFSLSPYVSSALSLERFGKQLMLLHVQAKDVDMEFIQRISEQLLLAKRAMDASMMEDICKVAEDDNGGFSIIPYTDTER